MFGFILAKLLYMGVVNVKQVSCNIRNTSQMTVSSLQINMLFRHVLRGGYSTSFGSLVKQLWYFCIL